jgi:hypothetical protein
MERIGVAQRRARLGRRHNLATDARASAVSGAAAQILALHATDPATVYRSLWARVDGVEPDDIEHALYDERSLVRLKAMRGTLFVVPAHLRPALLGAYGAVSAQRERKRLLRTISDLGLTGDAEVWLAGVEEDTLQAIEARGEALGRELSTDVPELKTRFTYGEGRKWAAESSLTTWVLNLLAADGRIVRARPAGSWGSGQYRWAPAASWFERRTGPEPGPMPEDEARAAVVSAWLRAFGPGTVDDLKWWTGFGVTQVRKALASVGAVDVDLDGAPGVALPDDLDAVADPDPWVAVLPPLDPTALGWKDRDWYVSDEVKARLFDRNGNIGPSIWCDGRIVGGWAQRPASGNGTAPNLVFELFEDIGTELTAQVGAELDRLQEWHGEVLVAARGRVATPLERELAA